MVEPDMVLEDCRLEEHRRRTFLDFYLFHLKHRAHPGAVYYLIPYLRQHYGWDDEETLWYCVLNGNTQNPVTSLLLHRRGPRPKYVLRLLSWWRENIEHLAWDTDRRYHRRQLDRSLESYLNLMRGQTQAEFWGARSGSWPDIWAAANELYTFSRLSAWSYSEYLYIAGYGADAAELMLADPGSLSHRNGLSLISGYPWQAAPYRKHAEYELSEIDQLDGLGEDLLTEARGLAVARGPVEELEWPTRLTLESALCTYKSWHKPNRRYPNVYNDMLYERLRAAEEEWPEEDLSVFWEARDASLPDALLLEANPCDPGLSPVKQNHYRETGEPVVMYAGTPRESAYDVAVRACEWGSFR